MNSSSLAIRVENLSKYYRLWLNKGNLNENLVSEIFAFIKAPLSNYRKYKSLYDFSDVEKKSAEGMERDNPDLLWALDDISFDVRQGEVLGIIGRNGAGKSTLLKVLSRITDPSAGMAEIRGRVSSLLEVGTGFHPELSGRENIYLNGTILGMRKYEIDAKFDQIVDFSGVEKFLDTPVKRYSSGMKVRLAFSVAAHLEPEVLIIDEVLAVGDADFQKKCLNKMQEVGQEGRTVLFVSHNLPAVTRLCERAILLQQGRIVEDGPSSQVVSDYLCSSLGSKAAREWDDPRSAPAGPLARLRAVRVKTKGGRVSEAIDIREDFRIEMEFDVLQSENILMPIFSLCNEYGDTIFSSHDQDPEWRGRFRPRGSYLSTVTVPGNLLAEGMVFVNASLRRVNPNNLEFSELSAVAFNVIDSIEGNSARGDWSKDMAGIVRPLLDWSTKYSPQ